MEDCAKRIDIILEASDDEILHDAGKITAEFAKELAETEFEKIPCDTRQALLL